MTRPIYILLKVLNALAALCLLLIGGYFVYAALRAEYDTTNTINPEVTLLFIPGIVLLVFSLLPVLSFVLLRQQHSKYIQYLLTILSVVLTVYIIDIFISK